MARKQSARKPQVPEPVQRSAPEQASAARLELPGLIRESRLFDIDYDPEELLRMSQIFDHLADQTVLDVSRRLTSVVAQKGPDFMAFSEMFGISPAEQKLLESLAEGLTVVAHASREGISVNTARTHMRRLLDKTGSRGQLDLIRKAHGKS